MYTCIYIQMYMYFYGAKIGMKCHDLWLRKGDWHMTIITVTDDTKAPRLVLQNYVNCGIRRRQHATMRATWQTKRINGLIKDIISWEPEGHFQYSMMSRWEPEGRYGCAESTAIAPFWFSTQHCRTALTPFWFSANDALKSFLCALNIQW